MVRLRDNRHVDSRRDISYLMVGLRDDKHVDSRRGRKTNKILDTETIKALKWI